MYLLGDHVAELNQSKLLISIATYNEHDNLRPLVESIKNFMPLAHILVVDDNSPDGTGILADILTQEFSSLHAIHRTGKLGLGTAIVAGMKFAIDNEFDYFMSIDADFSHNPKYIPPIFQGMTEKDVMIGSRYIPGGGTQNWPLSRKIISTSVNYLVKFLFWMPVRDASGGFRCYRTSKLKEVNFGRVCSKGYSFQQEMLFRVYRCGSKLGEYPIIFEDRRAGSSKVNWKEALRSISLLIYLGIMSRFKRNL